MSELPYLRVVGHARVKQALARALRAGRLPQTLLLYGPRGVGKQRLALWFGALVHCERTEDEPCGRCRSCRLAGRLAHPDLHWFFPTERPKGASAEKMREKIEEIRSEELDERRKNPFYTRGGRGTPVAIYLAAAQNLRALAFARPAVGRESLTVVGDAETLVPQEASPEAANALLKVLEEPPATSRLVLTSSVPGALLPTIRSRCLALRVPPLTEEEVARLLEEELRRPRREAIETARRSQGSIGHALELLDEEARRLREEAATLLQAALASEPDRRFEVVHRFAPLGARGGFVEILDELQILLRDALPGAADRAPDTRAGRPVQGGMDPHSIAAALLSVEEARGMAERNVNPQLLVSSLLARLNILLSGRGPTPIPRALRTRSGNPIAPPGE